MRRRQQIRHNVNREMNHDEVCFTLMTRHGYKGHSSIALFNGEYTWESYPARARRRIETLLRDEGFPYRIFHWKNKIHFLMLGNDRLRVSEAINRAHKEKEITREQRYDFIRRLACGKFPDLSDDFEVAFEFAALTDRLE